MLTIQEFKDLKRQLLRELTEDTHFQGKIAHREDIVRLREDMNMRFEQIDQRFIKIDRRFEQVDQRFEQIDQRFTQIDSRFEQVDFQFKQVNHRLDRLEQRMDDVVQDMQDLRTELNQKMDDLRTELNQKMDDLRTELNQKMDDLHTELNQKMDDLRDWVELIVGRLQTRAGRTLENIVAGALRLGLQRPDIHAQNVKLRQKIYDPDGLVFKPGKQKEVDIVAQNGELFVFEVKSSPDIDDVDNFADKVQLVKLQNPEKQIRGVFVAVGCEGDVQQACQQRNLILIP